jgi:hypothetical protein
MGNQTKFPSVPLVTGLSPPALQQFTQAVRENINIMNGITGDPLDANVSFRDLAGAGVIQVVTGQASANSQQVAIAAGLMATAANTVDYTPPPAPTNLAASGAMGNTILTWDMPTYKNHAYTEIWREQVTFTGGVANASVIGSAVLVGTSSGYVGVYADATGAASDCYYWVKFVSTASVAGPFNAIPGTRGTTSADPAYLLSLLTGNPNAHSVIAGFPFTVLTAPTVINGITIPAGVYLNGTMFQDGLITTSKLAAGAVTADKITATQLSAISANMGSITAGSMNINNQFIVDSFGNLTARSGAFSGSLSGADITGATGIFGGSLSAGTVDITKLIGTTTNYLTPGTYTLTVPADKTSMRATLVGGGGGGGGVYAGGAPYGPGSGGGSGDLALAIFNGLTPGATYTLTVGAGGGSDSAGGSTGISGLLTAAGGAGGGRHTSAVLVSGGTGRNNGGSVPAIVSGTSTLVNSTGGSGIGAGLAGAVGTYGTVRYCGGAGGAAGYLTGVTAGTGAMAGALGIPITPSYGGAGGVGYGAGGGGAGWESNSVWYTVPALSGGSGAGGMAIIEFFNPNGVVVRNEWDTLLSALTRQGISPT